MSTPPAFRPRVGNVLRIAVAAVGITAGLAGVPIVLWWAAGTLHYPTDVDWLHIDQNLQAPPVEEQVRDWLYHTYHALRLGLGTDGLLVLAVLAFGGLAWLRFVWLTLVELVLLARDGTELLLERAQQVGVRGWIASLLTTLALSTSATTAHAATAAPATAATAPPQPGTPDHAEGHADAAETTLGGHTDPPPTSPTTHLPDELRPDCPRYRVHAGDTLIRIASQHLGDAARWRDLAALNQPWLPNPNQLTPGWQLLLPPDAPAPQQPEVTEITVTAGDTLASLAETHLHDPDRLGELFDLNAGRTQPDRLQLAEPNILLAGWKLLVPLEDTAPPVTPTPAPSPADAVEPSERPAPEPTSPGSVPAGAEADAVSTTWRSAITVAGGGLLALSVAGAVAAAMRRQRRARDRTYRPGSGDRSPPPAPGPAVYALRLAADQHIDDEPDTASASPPGLDPGELEIGVREERTRAVELATLHGLGLTGPGAEACVRALLVHLLATTHATLIIPQQDAHTLLGTELSTSPRLQLATDEHEAVEELAHRAAAAEQTEQHLHTVVVAEARRAPEQLHTLLADGTSSVAGLLLGSWPTGASLRVRDDGRVTDTDSDLAELHEARLFSLNTPDTRELLTLLAEQPSTNPPGHGRKSGDEAEPVDDDNGRREARSTTNTSTAEQDATTNLATSQAPDPVTTVDRPSSPDNRPDTTRPDDADVDPTQQRSEFVLSLLGPVTLTTSDDHEDLAALLAPKHRALLVFLALHPRGTTRAATREALWPDAGGPRPYNAFYAALSQLRKTLNPHLDCDDRELIVQRHEHVALNPNLVDVDYWHLLNAENDLRRASTHQQRTSMWERIATCSHGELADGYSELWLDAPREHARRTLLDALSGLAAHHRDHGNPERQLQLLERARRISPENEALYRDILRAHAALGQPDAINRTIDLLTTNLADIGQRPEPSTLALARQAIQQHH